MIKISEYLKTLSENYSSLSLILIGLTYILGFLVVSIYYSKFGISTIDLINVRYILAGFWLIFPLIIQVVIVSFLIVTRQWTKIFYKSLSKRPKRKIFRRGLLWIFNLIVFFSLLAVIILIFAKYIFQDKYVIDYKTLFILIGNLLNISVWFWGFLFFFIIAYAVRVLINKTHTSEKPDKIKDIHKRIRKLLVKPDLIYKTSNAVIVISIIFWIFISLEYIFWFSRDVYQHIPFYLGGGKPVKVKFIPKNEKEIKQDFIKLKDTEQNLTITYNLLIDDGKSYFFNTQDEPNKIIIVPKTNFDGYIIE